MKGEINAAIDRLEARKQAAGAGSTGILTNPEQQLRAIWSGLDLSMEEIAELTPVIAAATLHGIVQGVPAPSVGASMYFDGIATGILIAEARTKQEARS